MGGRRTVGLIVMFSSLAALLLMLILTFLVPFAIYQSASTPEELDAWFQEKKDTNYAKIRVAGVIETGTDWERFSIDLHMYTFEGSNTTLYAYDNITRPGERVIFKIKMRNLDGIIPSLRPYINFTQEYRLYAIPFLLLAVLFCFGALIGKEVWRPSRKKKDSDVDR